MRKQLKATRDNLLKVQEQKAGFIDPQAVPPDLGRNELELKKRVQQLEQQLEQATREATEPCRARPNAGDGKTKPASGTNTPRGPRKRGGVFPQWLQALVTQWKEISILAFALVSGTWKIVSYYHETRLGAEKNTHDYELRTERTAHESVMRTLKTDLEQERNRHTFDVEQLRRQLNANQAAIPYQLGGGEVYYLSATNFIVTAPQALHLMTNVNYERKENVLFVNLEARGWHHEKDLRLKQALQLLSSDSVSLPNDSPDDEEDVLWWWRCWGYTYELSKTNHLGVLIAKLPLEKANKEAAKENANPQKEYQWDGATYVTVRTYNAFLEELKNISIHKAQYIGRLLYTSGTLQRSAAMAEFDILSFIGSDSLYLFAIGGENLCPLDHAYIEMKTWLQKIRVFEAAIPNVEGPGLELWKITQTNQVQTDHPRSNAQQISSPAPGS